MVLKVKIVEKRTVDGHPSMSINTRGGGPCTEREAEYSKAIVLAIKQTCEELTRHFRGKDADNSMVSIVEIETKQKE